MLSISSEDPSNSDISQEDQDLFGMSNYLNSIHRININDNLSIYLDEKMSYISFSPILPINKIDVLLKLYNLNMSKDDLLRRIIKPLNGENSNEMQIYLQNSTKIQKVNNNQIKIVDDLFIKNCIILSKASKEGAHIIAERITKTIFGENINYKYEKNKENGKKCVKAFLKLKDNIFIQSDYADNENEAKLDANKKIISKFLQKKISKEIINNINECLKKEEISKSEKKARYEFFLQEVGGDRNLLKNKRKITQEEFSQRLPYFNMLDKDKKKIKNNENSNNLMEEDEEIYFMNTENIPIDELLLGDLGIVDNHLKDFKYTPLKIFEMIRDSEKKRGVDLKMEYTQVNDKNYCINSEATIFSQKLGIKVEGFGNSKEESENKCALNMLAIIFKNKFKTYFDLHNYFVHKNKRYLDIILNEENSAQKDENNNLNNNKKDKNELNINLNNSNSDKKKIGENSEESNSNNNSYSIFNSENIEMIESMPIFFNGSNLSFENVIDNSNSNVNIDTHESSEIFNSEFTNINSNNNSNIRNNFGKLFNCNSYNNIINNKLIEELNENTNSSSSIESKKDIKKKKTKPI
jgi:hypothetical protein